MTSRTLRLGSDTYVSSANPSTAHADRQTLGLQTGAAESYLYFNIPFPRSATIMAATLRLYTNGSWGASPTVTVRRSDAQVAWSRMTWNNKTGGAGTVVTKTQSSSKNGDEWAIDVAAHMQAVADGASWYGFRITTDAVNRKDFYSLDAPDFKPTLDVTWSAAPLAPTDLSPSGGRAVSVTKPVLRFTFTDDRGDTTMQALRVQANATNAFTDPTFDSGTFVAAEPELDLSAFTYARSVSVTKTLSSATIAVTAGELGLTAADVGATITGAGIPAGTTITVSSLAATSATMSAAATTAGTVTATVTRTFAALIAAASRWWRVQVQDGAGLWSLWSDVANFRRDTKPALTITNPPVSGTVTEWTPPVSWTFTGQVAFQVLITLVDDRTVIKYDSGRIKGTVTSWTLPKGILVDGRSYQAIVRAWDTVDRELTPGDKPYIEATRDFTFTEDATVAAVTGFSVTQITPSPWVNVNFSRATAPDSFVLKRDGAVVDTGIVPAAVLVSGTTYRIIDRDAAPNRSHTWVVQAVVNGKTSTANPNATFKAAPTGIWVYDKERSVDVYLSGGLGSQWGSRESGETYSSLGAQKPVRVTQSVGGETGAVTDAKISGPVAGQSANYWEDQLRKVRARPGRVVTLSFGDRSFPAVLYNIVIRPWTEQPNPDFKLVDFAWDQVGQFDEVYL